MRIIIASAFSKNGSGGNKAGVCTYGEGLNALQKQQVAKELGFSETVYISTGKKSFKLEYFTPSDEVPLCGHATIAAFVVMRELIKLEKNSYLIETKSGDFHVSFDGDLVFMEQAKPEFFEILSKTDIQKCFDIEVCHDKLPIEIGSTGLRDIILPVKDLMTLEAMNPNFDEISALSQAVDAVGIHAFTIDGKRIVCRNFAPLYDIPEESATGTSNCVLACYLWKNNILKEDKYTFEQGYSLGSPSEIVVHLETDGEVITKVSVGGKGYLVGEQIVEV